MSNQSAFPSKTKRDNGMRITECNEPGMTILDYFAGQALVNMSSLTQPEDASDFVTHDDVAAECYRFADSMIKERGKRNV